LIGLEMLLQSQSQIGFQFSVSEWLGFL